MPQLLNLALCLERSVMSGTRHGICMCGTWAWLHLEERLWRPVSAIGVWGFSAQQSQPTGVWHWTRGSGKTAVCVLVAVEKPGSRSCGLNPSPLARTSSCVMLGKLQCLSEFSSAFVRKWCDCVGCYFRASSDCPGRALLRDGPHPVLQPTAQCCVHTAGA